MSPPVTKCNSPCLVYLTVRHKYRRFWRVLSLAAGAILHIHDQSMTGSEKHLCIAGQ